MRDTHPYRESEKSFLVDAKDHALTVALDSGLYRHLKFRRPDTGMYWFDLITWPGHLVIAGDMGSYHFARTADMFKFFGDQDNGYINPGYWGEKLQNDGGYRAYSEELFKQRVTEHVTDASETWPPKVRIALMEYVKGEILDDDDQAAYESGARDLLDGFHFLNLSKGQRHELRLDGAWEWDLKDYSWRFLWCCHAIRWGIQQYRAAKAETSDSAA